MGGMMEVTEDPRNWLAEMNRRVLAGRPIAASELSRLEDAYAALADEWGPPSVKAITLTHTRQPASLPVCFMAPPER